MKLTIETIKKLIKEELKAIHEAKTGRTIIAPGPVVGTDDAEYAEERNEMPKYKSSGVRWEERPLERGSNIVYDRDPYSELAPEIQQLIPRGSGTDSILQAYELQQAMDPDFAKTEYPDFTGMSEEEIEIHKEKAEQRAAEEFAQGVEKHGRSLRDDIDEQIKDLKSRISRLRINMYNNPNTTAQHQAELEEKVKLLAVLEKIPDDPYERTVTKRASGTRFNKRRPVRTDK